jgi:hypothetical protein
MKINPASRWRSWWTGQAKGSWNMKEMSESIDSHLASVKQQVFKRSNYLCECCDVWAYSVYVPDERPHRLACDDLSAAVAVCRRCLDYIEENPITGQVRVDAAERQAAFAGIYGQGADSPVFRLLAVLEEYKQKQAPVLVW